MADQNRTLKNDYIRVQSQLESLINAKSGVEAKEEAQYAREISMNSLKNRIRELEDKEMEQETKMNEL